MTSKPSLTHTGTEAQGLRGALADITAQWHLHQHRTSDGPQDWRDCGVGFCLDSRQVLAASPDSAAQVALMAERDALAEDEQSAVKQLAECNDAFEEIEKAAYTEFDRNETLAAQVAVLREALERAAQSIHDLSYMAHARTDWATCQKPNCVQYRHVLTATASLVQDYNAEVVKPWREAFLDAYHLLTPERANLVRPETEAMFTHPLMPGHPAAAADYGRD